jgi:hypothetical protein
MTPQTMSFKTALRLADTVQMWVHIDGLGGYRIDVAKAAVRRSEFCGEAPVGTLSPASDTDWIAYDAYDDSGRIVWAFDGSLLQIG